MTRVICGDKTTQGAFRPIQWSAADTDETLRQVKPHNAAYVAICGAPR